MGLKTRTPFLINRNSMAKTCLTKLDKNLVVSCGIPSNGVSALYLMHAEDVTFTIGAGSIGAVSFATGAKSYMVEGYKQNIQVTSSIRATDASTKLDVSVIFKIPTIVGSATADVSYQQALMLGKFYVLVMNNDLSYYVLGDTSPLEMSGIDFDSNANGKLATITLTAPEGSPGNIMRPISDAAKNSIISKSA